MRATIAGMSAAVLLCATLSASPGIGGPIEERWRAVSDERLANPEDGDWAHYRRTFDVHAFSPLTQITPENVGQLRLVWTYSVAEDSRWNPSPLVVNGIMYVSEGLGRVTAFDATTGDVLWIHQRQYPEDISISQAYPRARGVAVYDNLIYWGTADSHLLALDARTGEVVWDVTTGDYHTGEGHNHPPLIADGKIFLGHTGGDRTAKGKFRAYDARTGELLWTVNTAPEPGDPGFETWEGSELPPLGAVPWTTASYDPALNLVYFGTGQPTPWIVPMRGPGRALYSNSILAVDADTGAIRWHFQVVPNDNWDRDSVYENLLVDLPVDGRMRQLLIQTGKTGWGVVLDRVTGEFVLPFRIAYENIITGWTNDGQMITDPAFDVTEADVDSDKVFTICPHLHGGRNLNAASFSPLTGLYYVGANNTCMESKVTRAEYAEGRAMAGTSGPAIRVPHIDHVGEVLAIDPATGEKRWGYVPAGGAAITASTLATAGGLVFAGTLERQFFALDAGSGSLLWQTRLNADVSGSPVSFAVDGRQYIAVAAGGRPGPTTSFARLTNTTLPEGGSVIWVFALPDERDLQPYPGVGRPVIAQRSVAPAPPPRAAAAAGSGGEGHFTIAQAARGRQTFSDNCRTCHATSDMTGASLRSKWGAGSAAALFAYISSAMPEQAPGSLPRQSYADIIAWMMSESGFNAGASDLPASEEALEAIDLGGAG